MGKGLAAAGGLEGVVLGPSSEQLRSVFWMEAGASVCMCVCVCFSSSFLFQEKNSERASEAVLGLLGFKTRRWLSCRSCGQVTTSQWHQVNISVGMRKLGMLLVQASDSCLRQRPLSLISFWPSCISCAAVRMAYGMRSVPCGHSPNG